MRTTLTTRVGLGGLLVLLAACDGGKKIVDPDVVVPGPLNLRLTTPNGDDGAILFEVAGEINSIARAGFRVVASAQGTSPRRLIVNGNLAAGTVAQILVPDVNSVGSYSVTIREVAARGTYTLRDLQGYRIEVVKP